MYVCMYAQDAEAVAKDEVQRVLQMTEVRRRQWEKTWEEQRARLEQNLQMCQFFFDLRQVWDDIHFFYMASLPVLCMGRCLQNQ